MKRLYPIIKRIAIIISGFILGCVSFLWLGYSILTLGNFMEEPGSIDYVAEGEAMRMYGLIGCVLYVMVFVPVLFSLYKQKQTFFIFLLSMIFGGIAPCIYIFLTRW